MKETLEQPHNVPIDSKRYRLIEEYTCDLEACNGIPTRVNMDTRDFEAITQRIIVPKAFVYDGASIPRILWSISGIRPDGLIRAAALVHDFLYRYSGNVPEGHRKLLDCNGWNISYTQFTRKEADSIFLEIMNKAGISRTKRYLAYYAVRLFGRFSWKETK